MMSPQRYGRNIVAPPGNQAANRENKPWPGAAGTTEVRAIESDRHAGVSRGHTRRRKSRQVRTRGIGNEPHQSAEVSPRQRPERCRLPNGRGK
jgi:hypothetical protein